MTPEVALLGLVLAGADLVHHAPECPVKLERREQAAAALLRLRPACPLGRGSTHASIRALLAQAGPAREAQVGLGRLAEYPWLSTLLAREASAGRGWDPGTGRPYKEHANRYVAALLRGVPEFTVLFDDWLIESVSVEKVLVKPAAELDLPEGAPFPPEARFPWDAQVHVRLRRP
ncbi:MAG TPA: hypothetical protein VIS77_08600 [Burkholderiales bacterium]